MPDFAHKNEAFHIKNRFKKKMFKISFERVIDSCSDSKKFENINYNSC